MKDATPYTPEQREWLNRISPKLSGVWNAGEFEGIEIRNEDDAFVLLIDGVCYMTTLRQDLLDHACILEEFSGDVVLTGFGLGLGVVYADLNARITSVTVVEKDERILTFVAPMVKKSMKRLAPTIIHADADSFDASLFDCAYIDHAYTSPLAHIIQRYRDTVPLVRVWWEIRQELEASWR